MWSDWYIPGESFLLKTFCQNFFFYFACSGCLCCRTLPKCRIHREKGQWLKAELRKSHLPLRQKWNRGIWDKAKGQDIRILELLLLEFPEKYIALLFCHIVLYSRLPLEIERDEAFIHTGNVCQKCPLTIV